MKIYISADLEGIAGILDPIQVRPGERLYEEARVLLTEEVNVYVESLVQCGVRDIIVKDAHGSGFNFIPERLHPGALYSIGSTDGVLGAANRFPGLDSTFDGLS